MPLNIIGIITLGVVCLNIFLGFFVFLKNPKRANNIVYALSVSSIALWALFTYFYNNPVFFSPIEWLKIVYISSYWMLASQMIFAYYFPKRIPNNFIYYAIPILTTLIPSFYVLMIQDSVVVSAINYPEQFLSIAEMGSGYFFYTLPNVLGILLLAVYFFKKSRKFVGYEKAQVQFYILGALLMMVPLVIIDYAIPLANGDSSFFVYGPLFAIPFSLSLAYSILKNRFITIAVLLRKSLYFISVFIYILLGVILLFFLYSKEYFTSTDGTKNYLVIGVFCIIMIVIYLFLYRPLLELLLNTFSQDNKKREEILKNFSQVSNMELTVDRIIINVKRTIKQIFMIDKVGIILFDKRDSSVRFKYLGDFIISSLDYLIQVVQNWNNVSSDTIIIADEIKRETILNKNSIDERLLEVVNFMSKSSISAIVPFNSRTQLNGILLLGYRVDQYPLSIEEIDLLDGIMVNVSVSIGRAILYQEVQVFTETLKQKVNDQTKELQIKVKELEEARKKENDIIDIMGHELRTPATVVKLNVELLNKYIDSNPDDFKKYVSRIKRAVEDEIGLINTLLTSAKLEGNRVEINHNIVDMNKEIEMAIHAHEADLECKGLVYIDKTEENIPLVYADRIRVVEIVNNLVSNAIKYTEEGHIYIHTKHDENFVTVTVGDTGRGIPQDKLLRLGKKFERVDNYLGSNIVRPGGTGLGLFVTFSLVELMDGKMWIESELDKGSKFSFTLPRYKDQRVNTEENKDMFEKLGLKK